MFCPNCGTQNDSAATPCKKCGFKLSGISASKFKGTMMLNSDQTAQDLVDEHKQKRAEAGLDIENKPATASSSPGPNPGTVPAKAVPSVAPLSAGLPPSGLPRGPRSVLQPPRATTNKRRMGGTMLGVAPPAGGVTPPSPDLTATPPPVRAVEPAPKAEPSPELGGAAVADSVDVPPAPAADPFAGTVAMPTAAEDAQADTPRLAFGDVAPRAVAPNVAVEDPSPHVEAPPGAKEPAPTRAVEAHRLPAPTAALPAQPSPALAAPTPQDDAPRPRGIRPYEIALIVGTCGLYGIYLLIRQRKSPSP